MVAGLDVDFAALLDSLARDRRGAFPAFYDAFSGDVYTLLRRRGSPPVLAEDLCAETFLRAWRSLVDFPDARVRSLRPRPWLATIALNLARNEHRRRSRRPRESELGELAEPAARDPDPAGSVDGALAAALEALAPRMREAVVLHHVLGYPYTEVAAALGVAEGTARSDVSRGISRLRRSMSVDEEGR